MIYPFRWDAYARFIVIYLEKKTLIRKNAFAIHSKMNKNTIVFFFFLNDNKI